MSIFRAQCCVQFLNGVILFVRCLCHCHGVTRRVVAGKKEIDQLVHSPSGGKIGPMPIIVPWSPTPCSFTMDHKVSSRKHIHHLPQIMHICAKSHAFHKSSSSDKWLIVSYAVYTCMVVNESQLQEHDFLVIHFSNQ